MNKKKNTKGFLSSSPNKKGWQNGPFVVRLSPPTRSSAACPSGWVHWSLEVSEHPSAGPL